jgi:tetraacyldisaccharide 4'-kinase
MDRGKSARGRRRSGDAAMTGVRQSHAPWWEQVLRGQRTGWLANSVRSIARLSSLGYEAGVKGRELAYQQGWLRRHRLPQPTVCVGNISVGGTGKTPLVTRLVQDLLSRDLRPAVLLRGYKRAQKTRRPVVVRDAGLILAGVRESGDEAMELAERLPGAVVGVGADRLAVGRYLAERYPIDCFVLDDGFQHHRLERDINVVTIDVTDPWGGGALLPAGLLREPPQALQRADAVVLTRTASVAPDRLSILKAEVTNFLRPDSAILESRHEPLEVLPLEGSQSMPLSVLRGKHVLLASGIGNPKSFELSIQSLGALIEMHLQLGDHEGDTRRVEQWVKTQDPSLWLLTTEKDAMRWKDRLPPELRRRTHVLRMSLAITAGQSYWNHLLDVVEQMGHARRHL